MRHTNVIEGPRPSYMHAWFSAGLNGHLDSREVVRETRRAGDHDGGGQVYKGLQWIKPQLTLAALETAVCNVL